MMGGGDLAAFRDAAAALDERARSDARLEMYRSKGGGPEALRVIPDGWYLSETMERWVVDGGWWPSDRGISLSDDDGAVMDTAGYGIARNAESMVRWMFVGTVWEKDSFYTPLFRTQLPSAPLYGFSSQALWISMLFPHEAALLESFAIAFDECGMTDAGLGPEVTPFFVEWVVRPPFEFAGDEEYPAQSRTHHRLVEASGRWRTDHPCWNAATMPFFNEPGEPLPARAVASMFGVDIVDVLE